MSAQELQALTTALITRPAESHVALRRARQEMEALQTQDGPWSLEQVAAMIQGAMASYHADLELLGSWIDVISDHGLTQEPHPWTWFIQVICRLHGLDAGFAANRHE